MEFATSGVHVLPLVPVALGFLIAMTTTPAGVSGAFLLLPFQVSVLGFDTPGVTPTNLLYNCVSTPGGILRYRKQGGFDLSLVRAIVMGAVPGVVVGSLLRITVFSDPGDFKVFVGFVLLGLGANIVFQSLIKRRTPQLEAETFDFLKVVLLGAGAGTIGGVYGVSGGSIIAPVLVGVFHLPVRRVASAALVATLVTSLAGVLSFELIAAFDSAAKPGSRPDYLLALLFGLGGAMGGYTGARLQGRIPEQALRALLGTLALVLATIYISPIL
jgi:uncharacterized membrane protein YfcA